MVIYEVNLSIEHTYVDEFKIWLRQHILEMLTFPGFKQANLYQVELDGSAECVQLVVAYEVETMDCLNHYLTHHAHRVRAEGLRQFNHHFSAMRRVLYRQALMKPN